MLRLTLVIFAVAVLSGVASAQPEYVNVKIPVEQARPSDVAAELRLPDWWRNNPAGTTERDSSALPAGIRSLLALDAANVLLVRGTPAAIELLRERVPTAEKAVLAAPHVLIRYEVVANWRPNRPDQGPFEPMVQTQVPVFRPNVTRPDRNLPLTNSSTGERTLRSGDSWSVPLEYYMVEGPASRAPVLVNSVTVIPRFQRDGSLSVVCMLRRRDYKKIPPDHPYGAMRPEVLWQRQDNLRLGEKAVFSFTPDDALLEEVVVEVLTQIRR